MSSYTWYPSGFAIIDEHNQGVNDHSNSVLHSNERSGGSKQLLAQFTLPGELRGVKVTSHHYYVKALSLDLSGFNGGFLWVNRLFRSFNPETATWADSGGRASWQCVLYGTGWQEIWSDDTIGAKLETLVGVAECGLRIVPDSVSINTPAVSGLKIEISHEAAAYSVRAQARTLDPSVNNTLTWSIISDATFEPLAQTGAVLTYKVAGSDTEHTKSVTGAGKSVSIPANTFPVGTSSYKVDVTLEDGQVLSSAWANITVDAAGIADASPVSGYVANEAEILFSWSVKRGPAAYNAAFDVIPTGGSLQWRNGEGGPVTTVDIGTAQSYAMPANTLPNSADVQWRLYQITTAAGDSVTSGWMSVTTLEATSSAAATAPNLVTVDGSAPIVFSWQHIISTGTEPTGFEIQTSTDGAAYTQLVDVSDSSALSYTAPENTFAAGKLWWKVRTKNSDGTAGDWSAAAEVTVICAPPAPGVALAAAEARFKVRWSGAGQEAYEVAVDGMAAHYGFGAAGSYRHSEYLSDGDHVVSVRVQNIYGLWSDRGKAALHVVNSPGSDIHLDVSESGTAAALSWTGEGFEEYWIYRNGARIGRTQLKTFSDRYAFGACDYKVLGVIPDSGSYSLSSEQRIDMTPKTLNLTDTVTGVSLDLPLSEVRLRSFGKNVNRQVEFIHYAGSALPEAELGEALDVFYKFDCAFSRGQEARAALFDAMLGHVVCVRDNRGTKLFGPLEGYQLAAGRFYKAYNATVQATRFDEEAGP